MFGIGKERGPVLHCSECGGRLSRHVAGRCPSSVWDAPAEKLRAKQDADVAAAKAELTGMFATGQKASEAFEAGMPPRKLYGGELLNDLHKRVVALEDKAAVKDAGFAAGRRTALDEVEAVVRNHMRNRSPSDPVFVVLCNVLHRMTEMAK